MAVAIEINKVYSFDTIAPSILGASFKNAKVVSILSYSDAIKQQNVNNTFTTLSNMFPAAFAGTSIESSIFYKMTLPSGREIILASQYINYLTLELAVSKSIRIDISDISNTDVDVLKQLLIERGYCNAVFTEL